MTVQRTAWWSVLVSTAVSVLGDQLARVAVAVVVYQRSGSVALTALAYGLTLLPELAGGAVFSVGGWADRLASRTVMVVCAVIQAPLIAVIAVPGVSFSVMALAIAVVSALAAPARAAQSTVVIDLLGAEQVADAQSVLNILIELGQLLGLAGGAGVVLAVGTTGAVVGDAASFAVTAVLLWVGLAGTAAASTRAAESGAPMAAEQQAGAGSPRRGAWTACRVVGSDPVLRVMTALVMVVALGAVPAGIMAPLVHQMSVPTWWVGLLLAADCAGVVVGSAVTRYLVPARWKPRLIGPLVVAAFVPLLGFVWVPGPVVAAGLLVVSGFAQSYLNLTKGVFATRIMAVAAHVRTSAMAVVGVGMRAAQGVTAVAGGGLALLAGSPARAIVVVGVVGTALAMLAAWRWRVIRTWVVRARWTPEAATPMTTASAKTGAAGSRPAAPATSSVDGSVDLLWGSTQEHR